MNQSDDFSSITTAGGAVKKDASEPLEFVDGEFGFNSARVLNLGWLEQQDFHFLFGDGPMFNAARNDEEIALAQFDAAIAELHAEAAADDEEKLVFIRVRVPNEFAP